MNCVFEMTNQSFFSFPKPFLTLMNLHCSPDVHTFLCKAFVPACLEQVHVIHPCRNLCEKVYSDCKQLIDTFGITWPEELECSRCGICSRDKQWR